MKLSELEKLSDELLSGVPEDVFEMNWTQDAIQCLNTLPVFCATFREMLVIMQELPHGEYCNALKGPVNYGWVEENECDCGRNAAIKKAEEML